MFSERAALYPDLGINRNIGKKAFRAHGLSSV